jgi:purine-nucleoside phosphorylase
MEDPRDAPHPLDASVAAAGRALAARSIAEVDALLLLGTGLGLLPGALRGGTRLPLSRLEGVPAAWRGLVLHAGELGPARVLALEGAPGREDEGTSAPELDEAPWVRGWPCWLAASLGAGVLVSTSAGVALPAEGAPPVAAGSLVVASDHMNLSGRSPLVGLGSSTLGPLFPDQSALHEASLRARALELAREKGIALSEAVVACTLGPALETPAERRFLARAGAQVAVQELADPLLAAAHAGLAALVLVCVVDAGEGSADLGALVRRADRLAPALEELVVGLGPDLARVAEERGEIV